MYVNTPFLELVINHREPFTQDVCMLYNWAIIIIIISQNIFMSHAGGIINTAKKSKFPVCKYMETQDMKTQ